MYLFLNKKSLENAEKLGFNINCKQAFDWEMLKKSINIQLSKINKERLTQLKKAQVKNFL